MGKKRWLSFQKLTSRFQPKKKPVVQQSTKHTTTYTTPGVYVEEISGFPPSIAQVETAIPAFIGYTKKATGKSGENLHLKPQRISSMLDYEAFFGESPKEKGINVDASDPNNPLVDFHSPSNYLMHYALQAFFSNGGGSCYIVSVGPFGNGIINYQDLEDGLLKSLTVDEITLISIPESIKLESSQKYADLINRSLLECSRAKDRFAICDVYSSGSDVDQAIQNFRNKLSIGNPLKYGAAYYPYLEMSLNKQSDADEIMVSTGTEEVTLASVETENLFLFNRIKSAFDALPIVMPPSPAIAGQYAMMDINRGVWKAPANVTLNQVIRPSINLTNSQQENMNVDVTAGKSVNAIRSFVGQGTLIWGARTLDGNSNEWRYIPVVRMFMMVEESVKKATEQFVFEPNDANTWIKVKGMIENFLTQIWRDGGLAGAKPGDAFHVNVGLGTTMTASDILEGRMIVEIGMAVARPAEFIIFRIIQFQRES